MLVEIFKQAQKEKHLTKVAYNIIIEKCSEIANAGKDYTDLEKEFCKTIAISEVSRWWWKICDNESNIDTEEKIEDFINKLAVNAVMRGWQWFNWPSRLPEN